jgi:hypothetical protein
MATYTTDFAGESTGSFSTNWTNRYATASGVTVEAQTDAEDDRVLQSDGTDSGLQLWSLDAMDSDLNKENVEVLTRFQISNNNTADAFIIWLRASGASASEDGYVLQQNATTWQFARYNSGTGATVGSTWDPDASGGPWWFLTSGDQDPSFTLVPADIWLWVRVRVNGTGATVTLQARFWGEGQDEPTDWQIDTSDTTGSRITTGGWCGVGRNAHSSVVHKLDYFSVGTNGDSPTIATSTNTVLRDTGSYAQVAVSEGDPVARLTGSYAQVAVSEGDPTVRVTGTYVQVLYTPGGGGGGSTQEGALAIAT